jgi:uncharacterized protein YidB (DUF937 family)
MPGRQGQDRFFREDTMSLLNSVLGAMNAGGGGQGGGAMAQLLPVVMQLVQQNGGLDGLVQKFQQGGLGDVVQSWVSTGANLPVEGRQLQQALGDDWMATLAAQLGTSSGQASQSVATMLPELVDRLTPEGKVGDLQSLAPRNLESLLGGKLFG